MESDRHESLKRMAAAFLRRRGCCAVAAEVRCPIAQHRLDVAGYFEKLPARRPRWTLTGDLPEDGSPLRRGITARTAVVECKVSRADFLRDARRLERLLALREGLERRARAFEEERIKPREPHLRRSTGFLFAELESWDFTGTAMPTYAKLLSSLERVDEKLHGETKFCRLSRYRLADLLYIAAPEGMIRARELPPGWGLLEVRWPGGRSGRRVVASEDVPVVERVAAPELGAREERRATLLRNIAAAATRAWLGAASGEGGSEADGAVPGEASDNQPFRMV